MRLKPHAPLLALGLPRVWTFTPIPPRLDTYQAIWSIFTVDKIADTYYSFAALSLILHSLQSNGLIGQLHVRVPVSKHLLLTAQFRLTRKGANAVLQHLHAQMRDEDKDE